MGNGFSIDREHSLLSNLKSPQNDPVWDSLFAGRPQTLKVQSLATYEPIERLKRSLVLKREKIDRFAARKTKSLSQVDLSYNMDAPVQTSSTVIMDKNTMLPQKNRLFNRAPHNA